MQAQICKLRRPPKIKVDFPAVLCYNISASNAGIAQQVEHLTRNEKVISSNLITSSKTPLSLKAAFCIWISPFQKPGPSRK